MVRDTDSEVLFPEVGVVSETGMLIVGVPPSSFWMGDFPGVVGVPMVTEKNQNIIGQLMS